MEKDKSIKSDLRKLNKQYANIDKTKYPSADKLIQEIAFMKITLDELKAKINSEGAIVEGVIGNGFVEKSENPAQKSYNIMINNYNAVNRSLNDMLPQDAETADELLDFLRDHRG